LFISQGPSFLGCCKHHFTVLHSCRSKNHGAPAQALPSQTELPLSWTNLFFSFKCFPRHHNPLY
jgi:hypothetical protein